MKVRCKLTVEYDDSKTTTDVLSAVNVDDFDFVKSEKYGKKWVAKMEGDSLSSLLHTIDDYLACITVAEKVVEQSRK